MAAEFNCALHAYPNAATTLFPAAADMPNNTVEIVEQCINTQRTKVIYCCANILRHNTDMHEHVQYRQKDTDDVTGTPAAV
jgi:hypothetical protein